MLGHPISGIPRHGLALALGTKDLFGTPVCANPMIKPLSWARLRHYAIIYKQFQPLKEIEG